LRPAFTAASSKENQIGGYTISLIILGVWISYQEEGEEVPWPYCQLKRFSLRCQVSIFVSEARGLYIARESD
jgi:hypothetical protein